VTLVNPISSSRSLAATLATAVVALGALLALAPAAPAHPPTKRCASVPFTPASEDVAAEIRATGVSCAFARRFIRDSNGRPPRNYRGFTCARHRVQSESTLPHTRYRCTRASKTIRWKRF
jgi:hypothetical protein